MKVLLVDADSIIPNIPLMKISSWHKEKGDSVTLVKANIPYYPNRKKQVFAVPEGYDKVYCSVIFDGNKEFIRGESIVFGGTGVDLNNTLPEEVERQKLDYSLYPENDTSYGFISRGCIRNCFFCKVPKKEGWIRRVSDIDSIVHHRKVKFLDNNILALPEHKEVLRELIHKRIHCQFNQGLDIRLLDAENARLLSLMNYLGEYIFAFDSWAYRGIIEEKLQLLSWAKPYKLKFFVYIHPDMPLSDTVNRIMWLKQRQCLPYIMRDISCWDSAHREFYIDLASYCNQVAMFKKLSFQDYLEKRCTKVERISKSKALWEENLTLSGAFYEEA